MGALFELAHASQCGLDIDETKIPVGEAQRQIGALFQIDPNYCVGAGAMIITAKAELTQLIVSQLSNKGIKATVIGKVTEASRGMMVRNGEIQRQMIHPEADPYWEAFFNAFKKGLK